MSEPLSAPPLSLPQGWHTVTPRLVVHEPRALVEFLRTVFAARGEYSEERPAILAIGDSLLMISSVGERSAHPSFLYVYVNDTDRVYARALAAGATSLEEPANLPYGDRRAMVRDRWGNMWQIATPLHAGA